MGHQSVPTQLVLGWNFGCQPQYSSLTTFLFSSGALPPLPLTPLQPGPPHPCVATPSFLPWVGTIVLHQDPSSHALTTLPVNSPPCCSTWHTLGTFTTV